MSSYRLVQLLSCALWLCGAFASSTAGQAAFVETFDSVGPTAAGAAGPSALTSAGWIFRNQSEPVGTSGWYDGFLFSSFEGASHVEAGSTSTDFFGGDVSLWAILPAVAGQIAGDELTMHIQRNASNNVDRVEVRYSPGGGTGTGSTAHSFGDFTDVLLDVTLSAGGWQTLSATLPGNGRIAVRFAIENACNFGCGGSQIGLDLISVGPAPGPGCNLPPLPSPGQTTHWTEAGGPWVVCADVSIPASATVVIDAGAQVSIDPGKTVFVSGTMRSEGTALKPVTIHGGGSFFGPAVLADGEVELHYTNSSAYVQAEHGGTLLAFDSQFTGGLGSADSIGGLDRGTYLHVERCSMTNVDLAATDATLTVKDSDFVGAGITLLRGYLFVENVTIDGSGLSVIRERFTQPAYLGDLQITGSPVGGLVLQGWNFLVGDGVTLQGNNVPVQLTGGLLPGSDIPATGNTYNYVDTGNGGIAGGSTWGALAVPYVVGNGGQVGGSSLEIEAGATVQFRPGAALIYYAGAGIQARGRPDAPITFQAHVPGTTWNRLKFQSNTGRSHFQHVVFEDAQVALQSDNSFLFVDGSTFRNNQTGTWTNTSGLMEVRKSRYLDNQVGGQVVSGLMDLAGFTNPNEFVGNGVAVSGGSGSAQNNWWGSASGPTHVSNPGGSGDEATNFVQVLPYLKSPPNQADAPPRVSVLSGGGFANTGSKVLLRWDVEEDSAVVGHRIEYSPHGNWQYTTLVGGLPGSQRSYEWTVPLAQLSNLLEPAHIRIVAIDDAGQEGRDEVAYTIPYTEDLSAFTFDWLTDLSAGFKFGDEIDLCWAQTGMSGTWNLSIFVDGDGSVGFGGATTLTDCWTVAMPYISTDHARFLLTITLGASGRHRSFFSPSFSIRPDARLPDAAPVISLSTPTAGQAFAGGSVVPIAWTASDDEQLSRIRIHASYDGGLNWRGVVTLPGTETSYDWVLPASSGLPDVQLRVIAVDKRFQNSSDEVAIGIDPGAPGWTDLGGGTVGSNGAPTLTGSGPLTGGSLASLSLVDAPPGALMLAWLSFAPAPISIFGGTLYAIPFNHQFLFIADGAGSFSVSTTWPVGLPVGTEAWFQFLVQDPSVGGGITLSNGVLATTP